MQDPNYYSPEFFQFAYFSDAENNYMRRNKVTVWAMGSLMNLMFSGKEPWSDIGGKVNTVMDLICFSKNNVPYIKTSKFPISIKIKNVDLRILLRLCMEKNQIKRIDIDSLGQYILNYLSKLLIHDLNFDFYDKQLYRKGKL